MLCWYRWDSTARALSANKRSVIGSFSNVACSRWRSMAAFCRRSIPSRTAARCAARNSSLYNASVRFWTRFLRRGEKLSVTSQLIPCSARNVTRGIFGTREVIVGVRRRSLEYVRWHERQHKERTLIQSYTHHLDVVNCTDIDTHNTNDPSLSFRSREAPCLKYPAAWHDAPESCELNTVASFGIPQ